MLSMCAKSSLCYVGTLVESLIVSSVRLTLLAPSEADLSSDSASWKSNVIKLQLCSLLAARWSDKL
jgi:hypothetical protein